MSFQEDIVASLPGIRAFAIKLCRNTDRAEDLLQDTVVRALVFKHTFMPGSNLKAWLCTILRNEYFDQLRKRRREVEDADGAIAGKVPISPSQEEYVRLCDIGRMWDKLPFVYQQVLRLVVIEGLEYEEVASMLDMPIGSVKSKVNRGRETLSRLTGEDLLTQRLKLAIPSLERFGLDATDEVPSILSEAETLFADYEP